MLNRRGSGAARSYWAAHVAAAWTASFAEAAAAEAKAARPAAVAAAAAAAAATRPASPADVDDAGTLRRKMTTGAARTEGGLEVVGNMADRREMAAGEESACDQGDCVC